MFPLPIEILSTFMNYTSAKIDSMNRIKSSKCTKIHSTESEQSNEENFKLTKNRNMTLIKKTKNLKPKDSTDL